jgi:hypothetical protein
MPQKSISGQIERISINHVKASVSFMLKGDPARYLLKIPGAEYMEKDASQAFDLTQPGDSVEVSYWERSSDRSDGEVAEWKNLTLNIQGGYPDML